MRVVIVGAGKLGYTIAELLSNEQIEVVVIRKRGDLGDFSVLHVGNGVGGNNPVQIPLGILFDADDDVTGQSVFGGKGFILSGIVKVV